MGEKKFKLPDFKSQVPNFKKQAENEIQKRIESANIPDFMDVASKKMSSFKSQINNPNIEKITETMNKINAAKRISNVAKALGINVKEDQIQQIIDKKNELENMVESKSINAVSNFMEKEGYHIDSPEQMINGINLKLQKGDDPFDALKDTTKPFSDLIKDTLSGAHTISSPNIDLSNAKKNIINQASDLIKNKDLEEKITKAGESIGNITEKIESTNIPKIDISEEKITSEIKKKADNFRINSEIPNHIKKILNKYNIGGNS